MNDTIIKLYDLAINESVSNYKLAVNTLLDIKWGILGVALVPLIVFLFVGLLTKNFGKGNFWLFFFSMVTFELLFIVIVLPYMINI